MTKEELKNNTFIGIVEDNQDPKKLGRCKVRVLNIYDEIPIEDIPWATSWKDINGNTLFVPDKGKVVSVVFDNGNKYMPEYIYAEHFNINLEKKLQELSDSDYISMRALLFDHKTQIYSTDSEGLKIDYKLNNINITSSDININIKDNLGHVNIGTPTADQQAILGNNWLEWFDKFVEHLMGTYGGPYLANLLAPVLPNPAFIDVLTEYQVLRDPKFLSHNVNIVDNNYVDKQDRIKDGQIGDAWKSTIKPNDATTREPIDFLPAKGTTSDVPDGDLTSFVDSDGTVQNPGENTQSPKVSPSNNPDVNKLIAAMNNKQYKILTRPFEVNIVGIRKQYEGDVYSNTFKDDMYVFYKTDTSDNWEISKFKCSTMPGFYYGNDINGKFVIDKTQKSITNIKQSSKILKRGGLGILAEAQYLNIYTMGMHCDAPAMKTLGPQKFYRDNSPGDTIKYTSRGTGNTGMLIHRGYPGGNFVMSWSEGCQILSTEAALNKFFQLCQEHKNRYGNKFNYTLMLGRDL